MTYGPFAAPAGAPPNFDTVFVDPASYDAFLATGTWRDGATFVVEIRTSEHTGSIVHGGAFQTDLAGIEVEVKDTQRFAATNGWGFFAFDPALATPAKLLAADRPCYACHAQNAGVENTFTQFYPTLFAVAKRKGTVRRDFVGIPPSAGDLGDAILAKGWSAGQSMLATTLAKWPEAALLREQTLNLVAYRVLGAGKLGDALALFTEITVRFPQSANAWDSLSEALEGAKQLPAARDAAKHGLDVLAADKSPNHDAIVKSLQDRASRLGS